MLNLIHSNEFIVNDRLDMKKVHVSTPFKISHMLWRVLPGNPEQK